MNAEQLQEHENRGYALASAWLVLGETYEDVRRAISHNYPLVQNRSVARWRELAREAAHQVDAKYRARMAGCERAIEERENDPSTL